MAVLKYPGLQKYDSEIKGFIDNHYEPKLRFNPVPVYSVTLAEDTPANNDAHYIVTAEQLGGNYQELYISVYIPGGTASSTNGRCQITYTDTSTITGYIPTPLGNSNRISTIVLNNINGIVSLIARSGSVDGNASLQCLQNTDDPVFLEDASVTTIALWLADNSGILPAGTIITIYVAKEV